MRYQGRIADWKEDRGFGFIAPNGSTDKVFVHISAFGQRQPRPDINALVTYELVTDPKKGGRAEEVLYVARRDIREDSEREPFFRQFVFIVIAVAVGLYGWEHYQQRLSRVEGNVGRTPSSQTVSTMQNDSGATFQCQDKHYCSQMTSCMEATFYLRNCPGVEVDGDRNGIPCESQWCSN